MELLYQKAQILYATNHFSGAYDWYFKGEKLAEQYGNACTIKEFDYGMAMIAYKQKKFRDAIDYFALAFHSFNSCNERAPYQSQEELDTIALCYEKLGAYDSALYYYDSTLSFIRADAEEFRPKRRGGQGCRGSIRQYGGRVYC